MKKFKYKYEPVKRIKEICVQQKMKEIASITKRMNLISEEIESIEHEKATAVEQSQNREKVKSNEMIFLENYLKYMDSKIDECFQRLIGEKEHKRMKIIELSELYKGLKVITNLKDQYYENYLSDVNHQEQKEFDELASQNFEIGG